MTIYSTCGKMSYMELNLHQKELLRYIEGVSASAYSALGANNLDGDKWTFRVYAPNAESVYVTGDHCGWGIGNIMLLDTQTGVWSVTLDGLHKDMRYKYRVIGADGSITLKSDPFARKAELRPGTASILWDKPNFAWTDSEYMRKREVSGDFYRKPMSIYEAHMGSWDKGLTFVGASVRLVEYCSKMGYTHIELMPLSEHPLDDSWGYQASGYYSITARYGAPEELMLLVDRAHAKGIGVILDWVPAHFVKDECGLRRFDGTALYESDVALRAEMPLWGTLLFDYSKPHVRSFLLSNAIYLLDEFHLDGLRADAVSCMLYHDFCKSEWLPEEDGSRINRAAVDFIKQLNSAVHALCPGAVMIAEESSSFPLVTAPIANGGLGFDLKWNMGFMNDTLSYMEMDSVYRKHRHNLLTFPMTYAFNERYVLPFSHDEIVHGKKSLVGRMQGNYEAAFSQLRLLFAYQYAHPGKKLNFMGSEYGQFIEWDFKKSLDWFLLDYTAHSAMQQFVLSLNWYYRSSPALWRDDLGWQGFEWLTVDDALRSVIAFLRRDTSSGEKLICIFNFTPGEYQSYQVRLNGVEGSVAELAFSTAMRTEESKIYVKRGDGSHYVELPLYGYEGAYYRLL